MLTENLKQIAVKAKLLYQERLRARLEADNRGDFVCIEPKSGEYFLGRTFDDAVNKAIDAFPDRLGCDGRDVAIFTCRSGACTLIRVSRY